MAVFICLISVRVIFCNKSLFLDYSECGLRSKSRRSRMAGGDPSVHGMWPWQAGLYRLEQTSGKIVPAQLINCFVTGTKW